MKRGRWTSALAQLGTALAVALAAAQPGEPGGVTAMSMSSIGLDDAPSRGPQNAPVTIIEFSDFRCPFSARASRTLRILTKLFPTQVRWVVKQYPLRRDTDSRLVHEAALAAGEQGKFWEMYQVLMTNQNQFERDDLIAYAGQLQLDVKAFTDALDKRRMGPRVVRDILQGRRLQVNGTPTYFVNGKRIVGAPTPAEFRALVQDALDAESRSFGTKD